MLEECDLEYRVLPVDISPNKRMPSIIDHEHESGPVSVFESGAILIYLARRTGRFMPADEMGFKETLEWLFWQTGSLGPMAGQHSHFLNDAPSEEIYSRRRYAKEYNRCLGVLERRLADREFILGRYSIVDMACWPWVLIAPKANQPLDEFPNVSRWRQVIKERPAVRAGVDLGKETKRPAPLTEEECKPS
jgi:GST-like protein